MFPLNIVHKELLKDFNNLEQDQIITADTLKGH